MAGRPFRAAGRHDRRHDLRRQMLPPATVKWTPSVIGSSPRRPWKRTSLWEHAGPKRSTAESVVGVFGRDLAHELVVDRQAAPDCPRATGPRRAAPPRPCTGPSGTPCAPRSPSPGGTPRSTGSSRSRRNPGSKCSSRPLELTVGHLPAPRQQDDHVGLVWLAERLAIGPATARWRLARRPGPGPPHASGVSSRGAHEFGLGAVHDATADDPLVGEGVTVCFLIVLSPQAEPQGQRHRVAEEEHLHGRAGGRGRRRRVVVSTWSDDGPAAGRRRLLATAVVPS